MNAVRIPFAALMGLVVGALVGPLLVVPVEAVMRIRAAVLQDQRRIEDTVMVIVYARELQAGTVVREEDLFAVETPVWLARDGWLLSPEHVVGMETTERALPNEFVRRERLVVPDGDGPEARVSAVRWAALGCVGGWDAGACGRIRDTVRQAVGVGDGATAGAAAEILEQRHLVPERSPLVARLAETRAALPPPLPPMQDDAGARPTIWRFDAARDARSHCTRARKDPEGAVRLKEQPVPRADLRDELLAWAGDAIPAEDLARWDAGGPFVRCVGAKPLTVQELDALWVDVGLQSRR
ncbi:MAG: SAF domain-containing protein [Alphaproteobacteria bacterium]|nr:SAF domain-containing protein [Alphaproteobacteria bacterium]